MKKQNNKILIVEDDLSLRPFWTSILNQCGFAHQLDWAVSCEQAQKLLRHAQSVSDPYAMIITDIFLAGSDTGLDLLNSAEVLQSGAHKLLVSGADEKEIRESFTNLSQEVMVLSKPLTVVKCKRVLEKALPVRIGA